jgi:hypothetical protein
VTDLPPLRDASPTEYRHHFDRQSRRIMRKLLIASGLDPDQYPTAEEQWKALSEKIAGGVARTNTVMVEDPFALFVTFRCYNHRNGPYEQTLVAKRRDLGPIDEVEGQRIIEQFKASDGSKCEQCGEQLTEYTTSMTRMSVFQDQERQRGATPHLATP